MQLATKRFSSVKSDQFQAQIRLTFWKFLSQTLSIPIIDTIYLMVERQ
jgi:hypothetical protein